MVSPSASTILASYNQFRKKWPDRYLYLLWPKNSSGTATEVLKIPQGWSPTLGDYGAYTVNRDRGDITKRSDWYSLATLDRLPEGSKIALFIDKSGSMTLDTVRASYDYFIQRIAARKIEVITVSNTSENWIEPFIPIIL